MEKDKYNSINLEQNLLSRVGDSPRTQLAGKIGMLKHVTVGVGVYRRAP